MVCIVKLLKSWDLLFELPEKKCLVVLCNVRYPVLVFNHQIVAALSKGLCLVIVPGLVYANAESTMRVWGATDVEQATTAIPNVWTVHVILLDPSISSVILGQASVFAKEASEAKTVISAAVGIMAFLIVGLASATPQDLNPSRVVHWVIAPLLIRWVYIIASS